MTRWMQFLMSSVGNPEAIEFLRKWIRDMLFDGRRPEKILVLHGEPRSGKSVLAEVIIALAGHPSAATVLPVQTNGTGQIHLRNKKLLAFKETEGSLEDHLARLLKAFHSSDIRLVCESCCMLNEQFPAEFGILVVCSTPLHKVNKSLSAKAFLLEMHRPEWSDWHLLGDLLSRRESIRAWALA